MNTLPTLQYWDSYGRAEPIRMACHLGGIKYNNEMMTRKDFGERKAKGEFPLGSVPCWIEDGDIICQSNVILRMIGNRTGMYSTDPETAWNIDSAMEALEDTMDGYKPYIFKQVIISLITQVSVSNRATFIIFYIEYC